MRPHSKTNPCGAPEICPVLGEFWKKWFKAHLSFSIQVCLRKSDFSGKSLCYLENRQTRLYGRENQAAFPVKRKERMNV
jgi:hypothetical protein